VGTALSLANRSVEYLRLVRAEVRKVTWPTWLDLRRTTVVIVIFVIVLGIIIGIMDWMASKILIDFLGRVFG
jgi:preprotein translocase subunit SecE